MDHHGHGSFDHGGYHDGGHHAGDHGGHHHHHGGHHHHHDGGHHHHRGHGDHHHGSHKEHHHHHHGGHDNEGPHHGRHHHGGQDQSDQDPITESVVFINYGATGGGYRSRNYPRRVEQESLSWGQKACLQILIVLSLIVVIAFIINWLDPDFFSRNREDISA